MIPGLATLGSVMDAAKQRADMVNSQFVSDDEWTSYINGSYYELYGLLVQKYGDDYYTAIAEATADGVADHFDLADDFLKLLGVDMQWTNSPTGWVTLRRFTLAERNRIVGPAMMPAFAPTNLRYRLSGGTVWWNLTPPEGRVFRIHYVPRLTALVDYGDTIDGVDGWEEYLVVDAARKALVKEESDPTELVREKMALVARIESEAANRDAGTPARVSDVYADQGGWPYNGDGNGGYGF